MNTQSNESKILWELGYYGLIPKWYKSKPYYINANKTVKIQFFTFLCVSVSWLIPA